MCVCGGGGGGGGGCPVSFGFSSPAPRVINKGY